MKKIISLISFCIIPILSSCNGVSKIASPEIFKREYNDRFEFSFNSSENVEKYSSIQLYYKEIDDPEGKTLMCVENEKEKTTLSDFNGRVLFKVKKERLVKGIVYKIEKIIFKRHNNEYEYKFKHTITFVKN
ncbi:hypothetical protein [Mycoplasma procyoni]|uniref:hypothetical protein n=1 Tax=Mycoplasma procyoni TaxID=568784 RepID=UPI00197C56DB|nr:hypothetical protein [Mycoplasma procyoni]MBN3535130.1 hypothetical protein [Mycoplasma procyoni]